MHTFVGFNLQIVVAGPTWVLCNANPSEEHKHKHKILKTEYVGGLIRASAASFNTRGHFMLKWVRAFIS